MNRYLFIIIGMLLATYIPRLLPFIFIKKGQISPKLYRFLSYIPYAMLGALIVPGFTTGINEDFSVSSIAFLCGAIIAFKFGGTLIPILISVVIGTLLQLV